MTEDAKSKLLDMLWNSDPDETIVTPLPNRTYTFKYSDGTVVVIKNSQQEV